MLAWCFDSNRMVFQSFGPCLVMTDSYWSVIYFHDYSLGCGRFVACTLGLVPVIIHSWNVVQIGMYMSWGVVVY